MPALFTITRILQNNSYLSSMIMHDHIHAKVPINFCIIIIMIKVKMDSYCKL